MTGLLRAGFEEVEELVVFAEHFLQGEHSGGLFTQRPTGVTPIPVTEEQRDCDGTVTED